MLRKNNISKEKHKNKNVDIDKPLLRFNEFKSKWTKNNLSNICKIQMGQSPSSKNYTKNPNDTILVQGNIDLENGKVIPRLYTTQITKKSYPGNIILTVRAPVGDIALNEYECCIGRGVCSIEGNKFIYYLLEQMKMREVFKKYSQGSTFESINSNDIKNLKISYPSLKEQEKIANFLSNVDKKIELLEKTLVLYQRHLESLRFELIHDKNLITHSFKLNEICEIKKGKQLNKSNMIENGKYYVLNGGKEPSGFTNTWNVKENTITISEGGNSCGFVSFNTEKFFCGGHCYYLTLKKSNINLDYLFNYLKSIESKIMKLRVGSGLPNIQKKRY